MQDNTETSLFNDCDKGMCVYSTVSADLNQNQSVMYKLILHFYFR